MIEPKEFYRKLDSLLSKINFEKSGADFLFTIVKELGKTFGSDLHIGNGRIYEKNSVSYVLISPLSNNEEVKIETNLPINSPGQCSRIIHRRNNRKTKQRRN